MAYPTDEHDDRVLRYVSLDGFRLMTWDTGHAHRRGPQWCVGYRFTSPTGETLFEGEDYGCAPGDAIDSDACLRGILGFLTLRPGDTDAEYFASYTEAQLAFCATHAEDLSRYAMEEGDDPPAFTNLDDWEPTP